MSFAASARFRAGGDVHVRRFDGELVLLDLARGDYYGVNATGAELWTVLTNGATFGDAVDTLASTYDVARADLERDLAALVEELVTRGLLVAEAP